MSTGFSSVPPLWYWVVGFMQPWRKMQHCVEFRSWRPLGWAGNPTTRVSLQPLETRYGVKRTSAKPEQKRFSRCWVPTLFSWLPPSITSDVPGLVLSSVPEPEVFIWGALGEWLSLISSFSIYQNFSPEWAKGTARKPGSNRDAHR